jgi:hypothetical protein
MRPDVLVNPVQPSASGAPKLWVIQLVQTAVLAVLFAGPALVCVHAACAIDPDIWWHMRVGEWILQHHAVPQVEIFSRELAGKPWLAYSWLFELLVVKIFYRLGLVGIVAYSGTMILAITAAIYHLVRRLQSDFTLGVMLTFASIFCMGHLYTPRPWLLTILFFILELDILMQARRTGQKRELLWLPLIFALWANIHIEFIYGLFVLGLAWFESVGSRSRDGGSTQAQPVWMGCALLASALATLANPFGWRIYGVVYDLVTQGGGLRQVSEMQAIPFRDALDFLILALALGSVAALAWQRRFVIFETGLLAFACVMSFRSMRDEWTLAVVAAAILASTLSNRGKPTIRLPRFATGIAVLAAGLLMVAGFRLMHVTDDRLKTQVANKLPVHAVDFVQARGYAGPLYNNFDWGGYLIWALRMPVSIDGRTNLYGNERMDRWIATSTAQPDWSSDTLLTSAGLVIESVKSPITQVLRMDSHFQLVYEDNLAAVFVARK